MHVKIVSVLQGYIVRPYDCQNSERWATDQGWCPCVFEPCWVDREHFCGSVQDCAETDLWTAHRRWGERTERFSDSARSLVIKTFKYYVRNLPAGDWMFVAGPPLKFLVRTWCPGWWCQEQGLWRQLGHEGLTDEVVEDTLESVHTPPTTLRPQREVVPLQPWRGPSPEPSRADTMILNFQLPELREINVVYELPCLIFCYSSSS